MSRGSSASEEARHSPLVEVGEEDEEDLFRSSGQVRMGSKGEPQVRVGSKAAALLGLGAATTSVPVHAGVESARKSNAVVGMSAKAPWEGEVKGRDRAGTGEEMKEALPAFPSMRVELVSNQMCVLLFLFCSCWD